MDLLNRLYRLYRIFIIILLIVVGMALIEIDLVGSIAIISRQRRATTNKEESPKITKIVALSSFDVRKYLLKYNYMNSDELLSDGIKRFQVDIGSTPTGRLSDNDAALLAAPRCGNLYDEQSMRRRRRRFGNVKRPAIL